MGGSSSRGNVQTCGQRGNGVWHCVGRSNGCSGGTVWGTDVYTSDSNRCFAALHAGVITENGGDFAVTNCPGQMSYNGTTRNGVTTSLYGQWSGSFVVHNPKDQPPIIEQQPFTICGQMNSGIWHCVGQSNGCSGGTVWGTDVYTSDSNRCFAALHAGVIGPNGGDFASTLQPGRQSYVGTIRNGVTSRSYGQWSGSFVVHTPGSEPPIIKDDNQIHSTANQPTAQTCGQMSNGIWHCIGQSNGCSGGTVWGTDLYTSDSNKCSAALHFGIIGPNGGDFAITARPGMPSYAGMTRNGVTSHGYGQWGGSYVIHAPGTIAPEQPISAQQPGNVQTCGQRGNGVWHCVGQSNGCSGGTVWGTDVYTSDSNRCFAALHAGVIGPNGGDFAVTDRPGLEEYAGSDRNGVTSHGYGQWAGSFVVHAPGTIAPKGIPGSNSGLLCYEREKGIWHCEGRNHGCTGGTVWGTEAYTADSNKCSTALHAGVITEDGGDFGWREEEGLYNYIASNTNGVQSKDFGFWPISMVVFPLK